MKHTLLLIAFFLSPFLSFSQQDEEGGYKAVLIHYNAEWQVTKPEAAVYKRVAYFPTSLKSIANLSQPLFNHSVIDYYADGTIMAKGHYKNGQKWGNWMFYYPNGQLDCTGMYDNDYPAGKWEFWRPDGKRLMIVNYPVKNTMELRNFWNDKGEETIRDGNGVYTAISLADNGVDSMRMEGPYTGGYQSGIWTYGSVEGMTEVEQHYGAEGKFLKGINYKNGKRKSQYTFGNKFHVKPEPDHLHKLNWWSPDPAFYEKGYPVFADILHYEVQRIEVDKNVNATASHYYNVIQRFENGADTVAFGVPTVKPVFKGSVQSHINTHLKFPAHLHNQKLQGLVAVSFFVDEQGKVKNPSILKSLEPSLDEAVLRMISNMPDWQPGTINGKPTKVFMTMPIRIKGRTFISEQENNR